MAKRSKVRARNLEAEDVTSIMRILDGWDEKLTWEALIVVIDARLKARYTRQALSQHTRILGAFQLAKARLSGQVQLKAKTSAAIGPSEVEAIRQRNALLEAENTRLKTENNRLLEQFVVWSYNASIRGMDERMLNCPLPRIDRDTTKLRTVKK